MAINYTEVLRDLDEQIGTLEAEIETLRAGRPIIVKLRNKYDPPVAPAWGQFSSMGPTDAIPIVLKGEAFPLTTAQIADKLMSGGVRSQAKDFPASVSATLGQLRDKGVLDKVGDGWALKRVFPVRPLTAVPPPPPPPPPPPAKPGYADQGITDEDIPF